MKQPLDIVDDDINDFIRIGKHRWDMICYIFYGDPVYDIEGHSQIKDISIFLEDLFL